MADPNLPISHSDAYLQLIAFAATFTDGNQCIILSYVAVRLGFQRPDM